MATNVWKDQVTAAGVDGFNIWKQQTIASKIENVIHEQLKAQQQQNHNFENALNHMMKMRTFLSNPENILGSNQTKHGEVAEHLEVNVRNAWANLKGQADVATFEGVGRTAPEDFILDGIKYQSKFINGTNNSLSHVLNHFNTYQDSSMNYSIPKDQYQIIESVLSGAKPDNLSEKSVNTILKKVAEIEQTTGRSFHDIVKPSVSTYSEVQLGAVGETVTNHQNQLTDENARIQAEIEQKAKEEKATLEATKTPSLAEGVKVAGVAAAVSASVNTITLIYKKMKNGKKLQDFTSEDWKEIGLSSAKAGGKGGVTAGSIYALTNLTSLSAPFAGAVTSAAMGITSLVVDLKNDRIEMDEFVTMGQVLCLEAGVAAIGGAIGQTLIPIPVLGSIIGTVSANFFWGFVKDNLGKKEQALKRILDDYTNAILEKIEHAYKNILLEIEQKYQHYNTLIDAAFDVNANYAVLAAASVDLAIEVGVEESKILKSNDDLDDFFLA